MILINLSKENNLDLSIFKDYVYNKIKSCKTYKKTLHVFESDLPNNLKKYSQKLKIIRKLLIK
tara:strand:- start:362 stop:550 length:189 start_codon:yes stop_codon:yes gene_type:complete